MSRPDLAKNRTMAILNTASDGGYAVPAICCYNLEAAIATVRAAEAAHSRATVQLFPWALEYAGSALVLAERTLPIPLQYPFLSILTTLRVYMLSVKPLMFRVPLMA